jgi:hypothetical protein
MRRQKSLPSPRYIATIRTFGTPCIVESVRTWAATNSGLGLNPRPGRKSIYCGKVAIVTLFLGARDVPACMGS